MTDDAFDPAKVNLNSLLDYLLSKENNALDVYDDFARMKASHQKLVALNGDLLSQLTGTLNGLEESLVQGELPAGDKLCDKKRIEQFYRRKDDLFAKMIQSANFRAEEDGAEDATSEMERNGRESVNKSANTLRSLLNELESCESAIAECSAIKSGKPK